MKLVAVAIGILIAMPAWAEEPQHEQAERAAEPDWQISRLYVKRQGKTYFRGRGLYMTRSDGPAVGFTCQKQQVYAFVSVEALSIGEIFEKGFRNPAEWKVRFQIDDQPPREETWIWTYGGRVFMSKPGESADDLFKAAGNGATLMFHRDRGDPVTIEIPKDDFGSFDYYVEKCGLELTDVGSPTARRAPSATHSKT